MAEAIRLQQVEAPEASGGASADGDSQSRLDNLAAQATAKYAVKDYSAAAELYSRATELQAKLYGEMSSQNADLLYAYGRCLYHVAVSNSDVLGSRVAGEKRDEGRKKSKSKNINGGNAPSAPTSGEQRLAEEVVAKVVEKKEGVKETQDLRNMESKPYFQFIGDENFDDSDSDSDEVEDVEEDTEAASEEEDDFSNAYEVLDLARILLQRKLDETVESNGTTTMGEAVKYLKERLADTHDLQAEISLEGERFPNAVVDLKAALELKQELFPQDSSLVAEAHYKLSLALEFSSVTQQKDENGEVEDGTQAHVDECMREEAAKEMEAAIASCQTRIQREEMALAAGSSGNGDVAKVKVTRESIDDVKEMVKDMEQRLMELRQPPVSLNDPTSTGSIDGTNPLSGILGSILGESPEAQKARLEEASKGANDLTNLVKRKKSSNGATPEPPKELPSRSSAKRKVAFAEEIEEVGTGKKARIENPGET